MLITKDRQIIILLVAVFSLGSTHVLADGDSSAATTTENQEMLKPGNMSREDGNLLREYSARYNQCLTNASVKQMETMDDPRVIVDHAMKKCAVEMETLDQKMIERNFDPDFRKGYIRSVSNRSANNVLRTVMMGLATRQDHSDQTVEE